MSVWRPITEGQSGYVFSLTDSICLAEAQNPNLFVPVDAGRLIITSDYSGQHKQASHEAYSFLITTDEALVEWLPTLNAFRNNWLPDGRRISFKKLNEPMRWRAFPAFLKMVGELKGNLITILVDRRIGSFMAGGAAAIVDVFPDCFDNDANRGTAEKMFRLANFVAMIVAGLRREDQVSLWISDHDEALDSHDKREKFARLATYLTFGLTGWRQPADLFFTTTNLPSAPYWAEDLAAVADIAAGVYCSLNSILPSFLSRETWRVKLSGSIVMDRRARVFGNWLATSRGQFKHALVRLEQDSVGNVRSSTQAFVGHK